MKWSEKKKEKEKGKKKKKWSEARREEQGQTGREKPGWEQDLEKERDSGVSGRARSGQGGGEGLVGADHEKEAGETDGHPDPRRRRPKRAGVGGEGGACTPRAAVGHSRCARCTWRIGLLVLESSRLISVPTCGLWILRWALQSRERKKREELWSRRWGEEA